MRPHDPSPPPGAGIGAEGETARPSEPARPRVLIVEDQALIALSLAADLTAMSCEVVGRAATGEGAIELARRHAPDIVVMDVHLVGRVDGIEAAAAIQAQCSPRIIFVTAYADGPDRPRMDALRPAAILSKPYHPSELSLAVHLCGRERVRSPARLAAAPGG